MNSYRPLQVIATGGTIDKFYSLAGELEIGPPATKWLLAQGRAVGVKRIIPIIGKDSLDFTDNDRLLIAETVSHITDRNIVITHGTDTIAQTANYLAQSGVVSRETTLVLTGAIQPAVMRESDALFNLGSAITAVQILPPGIFIVMNGQIFPAGQVSKDAETGVFQQKPHDPAVRSSCGHRSASLTSPPVPDC